MGRLISRSGGRVFSHSQPSTPQLSTFFGFTPTYASLRVTLRVASQKKPDFIGALRVYGSDDRYATACTAPKLPGVGGPPSSRSQRNPIDCPPQTRTKHSRTAVPRPANIAQNSLLMRGQAHLRYGSPNTETLANIELARVVRRDGSKNTPSGGKVSLLNQNSKFEIQKSPRLARRRNQTVTS